MAARAWEFARALIWPVTIVGLVALYEDDVRDLLQSREINIAGVVEIGARVETIESNLEAELQDLRLLLAGGGRPALDPELVAQLDAKLSGIERNVGRELDQLTARSMEMATPPARPASPEPVATAADGAGMGTAWDLAREGLEALLERNVGRAIEAFTAARTAPGEVANLGGILRYLERERPDLASKTDDAAWRDCYATIITKYSWGIPGDLRRQLIAAAE